MKKEWLNKLKYTLKVDYDECRRHLFILGKWIVMGIVTGVIVGIACTAFSYALK